MDTYPDVPLVRYEDVRPLIRSGDILLTSGTSAMSTMIRAATNSPFSHIGFLLRLETIDRIAILESVESIGVRMVPFRHYIENYNSSGKGYSGRVFIARDHRFAALAPEKLCHFSRTAVDLFGLRYDAQMILTVAQRIVAKKLGLPVRKREKNQAYICSEYFEEVYASVGLDIVCQSPGYITPADCALSPTVQFLWELTLDC